MGSDAVDREASLTERPEIRVLDASNLNEVNKIVEAAVDTWAVSPRVKRLALPSYRYDVRDLDHVHLVGAFVRGTLVGFIALEDADPRDLPASGAAMLVHGIFVHPAHHRKRIGSALLAEGTNTARRLGYAGVLVKAERSARGFFSRQGMQPLPVKDPSVDYPHRYWVRFAEDDDRH